MKTLTAQQYFKLQSFYFAMYCYTVQGIAIDFKYWSNELDNLCIAWNIQNHVAVWAGNKEDNSFYLSTLLKQRLNVIVE